MQPPAARAAGATCPRCGQSVSGNFCSNCGAPQSGAACPGCRATLSPGARFCHACGAPLGATRKSLPAAVPWVLAGVAALAVIVVVAVTAARGGAAPTPASTPTAPFASAGAGSGGAAVDLSSMTPRERADRLYDRIMRAHERGDTNEIRFFKPMAIQAYAMLGELDADARYHVGLIHAITGDPAAALAQADSTQATAPGHLLAVVLRHRAAQALGDAVTAQQAYRDFLSHYEREIATGKAEYEAHRSILDGFRAEALRAAGEGGGP